MKTVIEMAREAGIDEWWDSGSEWRETLDTHLELFAELARSDERKKVRAAMKKAHVRLLKNAIAAERNSWPAEMEAMERQVNILTDALAQEREACAKVCDDLPLPPDVARSDASIWEVATLDCAEAIRARSST